MTSLSCSVRVKWQPNIYAQYSSFVNYTLELASGDDFEFWSSSSTTTVYLKRECFSLNLSLIVIQ